MCNIINSKKLTINHMTLGYGKQTFAVFISTPNLMLGKTVFKFWKMFSKLGQLSETNLSLRHTHKLAGMNLTQKGVSLNREASKSEFLPIAEVYASGGGIEIPIARRPLMPYFPGTRSRTPTPLTDAVKRYPQGRLP